MYRRPIRRSPAQPDVVSDITTTTSNVLTDPAVLVTVGIVGFILFSHINDPNQGIVAKTITNLRSRETTKPLGNWLADNVPRYINSLVFIPPVVSTPPARRTIAIGGIALWITFGGSYTLLQYGIQSASITVGLRLRTKFHRFLAFGACATLIYMTNPELITKVSNALPVTLPQSDGRRYKDSTGRIYTRSVDSFGNPQKRYEDQLDQPYLNYSDCPDSQRRIFSLETQLLAANTEIEDFDTTRKNLAGCVANISDLTSNLHRANLLIAQKDQRILQLDRQIRGLDQQINKLRT